jgi:2-oxoglutarate ferredoxin oxidoreductase subunit delta
MKVFGRAPINRQSARIPQGQVYLIPERCKGCGICIEFCPQDVLCISEQANGKGYHLPEILPGKEKLCVHCQFCSLVCPEFAIFTREAGITSNNQQLTIND